MKKLALHWQILIGIGLGVLAGVIFSQLEWYQFSADYIAPFGEIFLRLLKMLAVPLVLFSLINGISNMSDMGNLTKLGGKTIVLYVFTTMIAVSVGLLFVNLFEPGNNFSESSKEVFQQSFAEKKDSTIEMAAEKEDGPLFFLLDMFPKNIFAALNQQSMLQIIMFALLFGAAMVSVGEKNASPIKKVISSINDIFIQIVYFVMYAAPYGVFALITALLVEFSYNSKAVGENGVIELLQVLGMYSLTVIVGLTTMIIVIYPIFLRLFKKVPYFGFLKSIFPAQLTAFSTSSSAATLPVTMQCCENNLKISKEVSSFVLPLGATVNMDGSSLYQGVAAVFIAQVYGIDLSLAQQLGIVFTATLASIGTAAVPGAALITLVIILEQAGIPIEGLVLIFAPDRILDMLRTVVNITGDSTICKIVDKA